MKIFKNISYLFFPIIILFWGIEIASADTHYVATTGADAGNCTVAACLTIDYAIDQAIAGDVVQVGDGSFPDTFTLDINATLQSENGVGSTTLNLAIGATVNSANAVLGTLDHGFTINTGSLGLTDGIVQYNTFSGATTTCISNFTAGTIRNNLFLDVVTSAGTCIFLNTATGKIYNNVFDTITSGISGVIDMSFGTPEGWEISNNVFYNNNICDICGMNFVGDEEYSATITNNIFSGTPTAVGNFVAGIVGFGNNAGEIFNNNVFFNNVTAAYDPAFFTHGATEFNENPDMVDPAADDFSLDPASPAVDSGIDVSAYSVADIIGTVRPTDIVGTANVDNGTDIGAYEYFVANTAPSATAPASISQAITATGYVTFSTTIHDDDSDDTTLRVYYSDDNGLTWYDPSLVSVTSGAGTVDLDNAQVYQIGSVDAIDTSAADITLTIVWNTKSASNGNGTLDNTDQSDILIRVMPNDATIDGAAATSLAFEVDNLDPSGIGSLTTASVSSTSAVLNWNAVTETNFDTFEIWYGTDYTTVSNRTASKRDRLTDVSLGTASTNQLNFPGLSSSTTYYFGAWAKDDFGNEISAVVINVNIPESTPGGGGGASGGDSSPDIANEEDADIEEDDEEEEDNQDEKDEIIEEDDEVDDVTVDESDSFDNTDQQNDQQNTDEETIQEIFVPILPSPEFEEAFIAPSPITITPQSEIPNSVEPELMDQTQEESEESAELTNDVQPVDEIQKDYISSEQISIILGDPADSDSDGFSDSVEKSLGTDPNNSNNSPTDTNSNNISDAWEVRFSEIQNEDGAGSGKKRLPVEILFSYAIDSDNDGISNYMEGLLNTNPLNSDSDLDGWIDGDEFFMFQTDPMSEDLQFIPPLKISNISSGKGQKFGTGSPYMLGTGKAKSFLIFVAIKKNSSLSGVSLASSVDSNGNEIVLGMTQVSDNGKFAFKSSDTLPSGKYSVFVREIEGTPKTLDEAMKSKIIKESEEEIEIDLDLEINPPTIKKIDEVIIDPSLKLENLDLIIENNRPKVVGKTNYGSQVVAAWQSIVLTSVLLTDTKEGDFETLATEPLQDGDHQVTIYAKRIEDNAVSGPVTLAFKIDKGLVQNVNLQTDGTADSFFMDNFIYFIIAGILILISSIVLIIKKSRKREMPNM